MDLPTVRDVLLFIELTIKQAAAYCNFVAAAEKSKIIHLEQKKVSLFARMKSDLLLLFLAM